MLNNKTALRILSLVIAVCLWVYVMGEVNPDTTAKVSNIEVTFINTDALADDGLAVVQEDMITISATIKGKRSDVNETKNSGLSATVDVSGCQEGSNDAAINLVLPNGISLDSMSQEAITFDVEEITEDEKPVEIQFTGDDSTESDQEAWLLSVNPDTVTVSGAESSVKKVSEIRGTVATSAVGSNERTVDVVLTPVTDDGEMVYGINLGTDMAQAHVQLLNLKTVDLNLTTVNLEEGWSVENIKGPDSVNLIGTEDALASIDTIEGTVDMTGITESGKQEIRFTLPEHVYLHNQGKTPTARITLQVAD